MTSTHHIVSVALTLMTISAGSAVAQTPGLIPPPVDIIPAHISIDDTVVGAGVASTGKVYTWYEDGTVTAGSSSSLDDYRTPYSYSLPPNKQAEDIVAMAISKNDRVYTWYDDYTRSVGTSADLDAYEAPQPYKTPAKGRGVSYAPQEIVGVTINVNDQVRTYYRDGKSSTGTSRDLGKTGSGIAYQTSGGRHTAEILAMGTRKAVLPITEVWYRDGYYSTGTPTNLGSGGDTPYSQHLTLYSFKKLSGDSEPGAPQIMGPGPVEVVRSDLGSLHEPVIAPGKVNVAAAYSSITVFRKTGEKIFDYDENTLFADYLDGSNDPVLNLNSHAGIGDCKSYPQTELGKNFCIFQTYDTRAAYDKIGNRFIFLSNARNYVWKKEKDGSCISYVVDRDSNGDVVSEYSNQYCDTPHRHLVIAVSVSENPADGFHLYAIKENNYRDWPVLAVQANQLIVGHANGENPDGYAAIVFNLSDMKNGVKRPRYFRLDKDDLNGSTTIRFPRQQDEAALLTIGVASSGKVYGFSKFQSGYNKPQILHTQNKVPAGGSVNYVFAHGALRIARSASVGGGDNPPSMIHYARYPLTVTPNSITLHSSLSQGAVSYAALSLPSNGYKTFTCARLAVTGSNDEVIAFAGAIDRSRSTDFLSYDAAFTARTAGSYFPAPEAWKAGLGADPDSFYDEDNVIVHDKQCQQQGGAAPDPYEGRRVWMMHNYSGSNGAPKGALGWIDVY